MRFRHCGSTYSATRITGPRHNYLAITFATEARSPEPQVIELPPQGGCEHPPLDGAKVLAAVLAGVAEGNREFGASFAVATVQYVANDTGPEEVYHHMARALVEEASRHQAEQRTGLEELRARGR
jgi:hypothetical protein